MTVYLNKERGRWSYDFQRGGKRFKGYCLDPVTGRPVTSRRQAEEVEAELKARARQTGSSSRPPAAFSITEAMALHLAGQADSSKLHRENVAAYAREILAFFGPDTPVVAIDDARVEAYRAYCLAQPVTVWKGGPRRRDRDDPRLWSTVQGSRRSPASVNHRLKCLRAALLAAHRARDPVTGMPALPFPPTVRLVSAPKRLPRPMPDAELDQRLKVAPPWVQDAAQLARLFGLRRAEALQVTVDHLDHDRRALRFSGDEAKSGRDEFAHGGQEGWELVERLAGQARRRRTRYLVTWPGHRHWRAVLRGRKPKGLRWVPLRSIRRSWRTTAATAGVEQPHRFHDVRAAFVTSVARVASAAVTQEAARHADAGTTRLYIGAMGEDVARAVERAQTAKKPG